MSSEGSGRFLGAPRDPWSPTNPFKGGAINSCIQRVDFSEATVYTESSERRAREREGERASAGERATERASERASG